MGEWVASGRVLDAILLGVAAEAVALLALWRLSHRGVAPRDLLPNLVSGACLLLAMRAGLAEAWWGWVSLFLLGALAAHLADMSGRWRRG